MAVRSSLNKRTLITALVALFLLYYFWNLTLYSARLCETQKSTTDKEKDNKIAQLEADIHERDGERVLLQNKLKDLQSKQQSSSKTTGSPQRCTIN
jgi:hypothetical protein